MSESEDRQAPDVRITGVTQIQDRRAWAGASAGGTFVTKGWAISVTNNSDRDVSATLHIKQSRNGAGVRNHILLYDWIDSGGTEIREFKPFYDKDGGFLTIVRVLIKYRGEEFVTKTDLPLGEISTNTGGACFVATVCFGDAGDENVEFLRDYRDNVLMSSSGGRRFVRAYYRWGPALAVMVKVIPGARLLATWMLRKAVASLRGP